MTVAWTRLPRTRTLILGAIILIGLAVASLTVFLAVSWLTDSARGGPGGGDPAALLRAAAAEGSGAVMTGAAFRDGAGRAVSLADFRGQVVVLNLWATWCGPCLREMPALDRLQAALGGEGVAVVAVSTDRASVSDLRTFFRSQRLRHLPLYHDRAGDLARALALDGLPTTHILDRDGRLLATHKGYLAWDHPGVIAWLRGLVAGG
ncbi:TlpA disulfide reductase family protein [Roseospira visakhapatnamensis]|uniref:Thiol-disulfide isomerase/thioredoxin n=1 Tax=Roseospira visakhapatnamensis TaxID=390880 RepID=A0A7W6RAS8_9PROT|nr:TlpA disulfide reductase family protein [Roseospira visakhapatnamensis]MBB4264706.1 thiol-disulfide isomerase/thioredoxin [Roseospira visakhapatnamensis]